MSDLRKRRKMKDKSNLSDTIFHKSLIKTQHAENWGISFFYKDTKKQIEWTVIVALMAFINQTGSEVSYVLTNQKFKEFAIWQENSCLGKKQLIVSNGIETNTIEVEDEL